MKINSSVLLSKYIKAYTLKMVSKAKASHVGGGLSISDILAVLYNNILYFDSQKPLLENRDRFILSKGHCCAALYATLALKNFLHLETLIVLLNLVQTLCLMLLIKSKALNFQLDH